MTTPDEDSTLREELERLRTENEQLKRNIASQWLYGAWKHRAQVAEAELAKLRASPPPDDAERGHETRHNGETE